MREETRRKFEKAARWENARNWLPLAFGFVVFLLAAYYITNNLAIKERPVAGVVQRSFWKIEDDTGQRYPVLQVHLDEGRLVHADTFQPDLPPTGSNIVLRERTWVSGYHTYSWEGPAGEAGKP